MMQQLSLGFGYVLLRITDLFNFLFSVKAINKFYDRISEKAWLKFECDTFDYGYYYAMYTTLINITTTFGVQVPLLYFLMCIVLIFKLFADGVKFTNIHGWDLEGSGKLFEVALRRLLIGTTISHTLLVNQCFWGKLWRTMSVNVFMLVYSLVVYFMFKKKSIAKLSTILRILQTTATSFKKPSKSDLRNWLFRYNHPFLCNLDQAQLMQEMEVFQSNTSSNDIAVRGGRKRRFNKPISIQSPSRPGSEDKQDKEEAAPPDSHPPSKFSSNRDSAGQQPDLLARLQEHHFRSSKSEDLPEGSKVRPKLKIPSHTVEGPQPADSLFTRSSRFRRDGSLLDPAFKFQEEDIEEAGEERESSPLNAQPKLEKLHLSRVAEDEEEHMRESQVRLGQVDSFRSKKATTITPKGKEFDSQALQPKKKSIVPVSMRESHEAESLDKRATVREDKDREKTQVSHSPLYRSTAEDRLRSKQNTQEDPIHSSIPSEPSRQIKSLISNRTNPPAKTAANIGKKEASGADSSIEKIQPSEESPIKGFRQGQ
jgi:Calcium-dependent channel, 7TM region, putative phosphate